MGAVLGIPAILELPEVDAGELLFLTGLEEFRFVGRRRQGDDRPTGRGELDAMNLGDGLQDPLQCYEVPLPVLACSGGPARARGALRGTVAGEGVAGVIGERAHAGGYPGASGAEMDA
jgi:hypothetical protein